MSLLKRFPLIRRNKLGTASVAKERLQIIISHERSQRGTPEFLPRLQQEVLDVIRKYVAIEEQDLQVDIEQGEGCSILEFNITLPDATKRPIEA